MSNEFKLSANDISALKMLGLGDNIANIEKQIGKMPSVLRRQKENEINKLYKNEPRKAKKALAEYDYNLALNSGDADAIKQSGKNLAKAEQEAAADISTLSRTANAIQKGSQAWVDFFPWANQKIAQGAKWFDDKGVPFLGDMGREIHKALDSADTLNSPLNKINPLIAIPEMLNRAVGNEPSKKESDKERLARPNTLKEQQEILDRAYHTENPNSWNIAGTAGEFLAPAELATFAINAPIKTGGNFASRVLPNFYKNALVASAVDLPANASDSKNLSDFGTRAGLGLVGGGLLGAGIGEIGNKIANRSANKIVKTDGTEPNSVPNTQNSSTAPNTPNSNADDLATNGSWIGGGNTPPPNGGLVRGDNFVTDPKSAKQISDYGVNVSVEDWVKELGELNNNELSANLFVLQQKHPEFFEKPSDVYRTILEIKNNPTHFFKNNRPDMALIAKRLEDNSLGKMGIVKDSGKIGHLSKSTRDNELARLQRINTEQLQAGSPYPAPVSSNKLPQHGDGASALSGADESIIPQHPLNTADIIDLVPDENGVYGVAYNGSSKELAKIATEIAKGEIQSLGAKRLVFIADNIAEAAAKDAEQKISANIAKIDDDSVELYANNTALLGDIAKKYPMLNKDEQIELANKQILANASAELLEYSKFLNGGSLPNDARLLGKNAGRMILKSLNAGASKQEIIDMLLKAGISGRNSTAAKALIQTGDINAYNAQMRKAEAELIAELSQNVRVAAKNESIGAILGSAKAKALENDELLKKGVGNQGLASAAKKSELVAPKNADEVAVNSRTPSDEVAKVAENTQGNSKIASDKTAWAYDKPNAYNAKFSDIIDSSKSDELFEALAKVSDPKKQSAMFKDFTLKNRTDEFSPSGEYNAKFTDESKYLSYLKDEIKKLKSTLKASGKDNMKLANEYGEFAIDKDFFGKTISPSSIKNDANVFDKIDHYTAVNNAFNIFRNSKKLAFRKGFESADPYDVQYYVADAIINGKQTQVLFTLRELKDSGNARVYNLELDLSPSGLKANSGDQPPLANKGHKSVATSSEAAPLKDSKNSTTSNIKSQEQLLAGEAESRNVENGSGKVYNLEVDLIPDELKAVANRTQQGPAGWDAKVATPKHEVKTDTANSSRDEIKSQEQKRTGLKRGFSTAEMPSAMLGGAAGHMAGSAATSGEYESEGGVAGAIIGALAGLASPKAATKIAAKMIAKKASKIELMPNMPFKEAQDKVQKDLMKYVGVDIKNADSGIVAQINNNGAKKIVSNDAIQKSRNNKFSAGEHLSVAQKTLELFKNATFIGRYDDIKNGESSVKILRFAKNIEVKGKNAVAIITAKESVDKDLKRIYSMGLEELRKAELKFGNYDKTQTPASKPLISQDNGVVNSVAPIKDGANSTPKEIKSQELSMRESFSPELKASYDMRDKLLKSTNEVRASLNEKGKAELEKLAGSKDSKLSRDAQIMKTLENAKSDPVRYAKLKKLYLDENGKVKDSIGLC